MNHGDETNHVPPGVAKAENGAHASADVSGPAGAPPQEALPPDPGLRAPHPPLLNAIDPPRKWTVTKVAVQVLGFLIGIAMLVWAVSLALSDDNAAKLQRLGDAPPGLLASIIGLSAFSIALNGAMFWVTLLKHKRLRLSDTIATNAIAVFMSILPFKLGLLARLFIHHRRDGVPFRLLLAWFAAMSALAMAFIVPLCAVSLWRGRVDALWWGGAIVGTLACNLLGWWCGRAAEKYPILARLSLGAHQIVRDGPTMLRHAVLRTADVGVLTARFLVAGWIVGLSITPDKAALYATTYFLLSVVLPAGTLGAREMGVAGVSMLSQQDQGAVALVTLVVTGAETATSFVLALAGAAWLRLDRLFGGRARPAEPEFTTETQRHRDEAS